MKIENLPKIGKVKFQTNEGERTGDLLQSNPATVWVRLHNDNNVIKRHKVRHQVKRI